MRDHERDWHGVSPFTRLTGQHLAYGLALVSLLGGAYLALRRPCPRELVASRSLEHTSLAQYYQEEASRLAADSSQHSTLALQSGAKGAGGGPEAELWRALAEYSLLLASPAGGQSEQPPFSSGSQKSGPAAPPSGASDQRTKKIGAPQVIEIPLPEPPPLPSPSWQENVGEQHSQGEPSAVPSSTTLFSRPGYLGVLYATAEDGPAGVNVLGITAGSPAERAGFSPASSPFSPTRTEQVLQVVTILLALSPGWPLVIPLMIAQDKHHRRSPRGDLIVAVDGQPVRDAQEFNDVLRHFGPGDTVTFVVQRGSTQVHLSAQLEAEPQ